MKTESYRLANFSLFITLIDLEYHALRFYCYDSTNTTNAILYGNERMQSNDAPLTPFF